MSAPCPNTQQQTRDTPSELPPTRPVPACRDHAHCRRTRHVYVSARSPRSSSGRFGRSPRRGGPHLTPRLAVIARFGCLNHVSSTLTSSSRVSMFIWKVPPRVSLLLIWKVLLPAHRSLVTWESPTENPTDVGFVTVPHMQRPMQRPTPPLVPSLVGFVTARPLCRVSPIRRRFRHSPTDIGFVISHRRRFRHSPTDIGFVTAGRFHEWRRSGRPACWPGVRCSWGTRSGWGSGARATGAGELPAQAP